MRNNDHCSEKLIKVHPPCLGSGCLFGELFEYEIYFNLGDSCLESLLFSSVAHVHVLIHLQHALHQDVRVPQQLKELRALQFARVKRLSIEAVELEDAVKALLVVSLQLFKHCHLLLNWCLQACVHIN